MVISEDVLIKLIISILGFCGFWVARYIHKHKKVDEAPLVCPLKFDCHAVVHSDYSKFLGVPLEVYGMLYYTLVCLGYLSLVLVPILPAYGVFTLVLLSFAAFLFSLYLIFIQIFVLKQGCFWCFISAIISILIFALTFLSYDLSGIIQNLVR